MKVSVIVLVYNSALYIHKCIESILAQTFRDFELLLIDDESTDSSNVICRNFCNEDSRIKLFERTHSGISSNREFGLQMSNGDYVLYVDSDDSIEPNMLEVLVEQAKLKDADISACSFDCIYLDRSVPMKKVYNSKEDYLRAVLCNDWGVLWKNLIRRSLFIENHIHFPSGIDGGEDYVVVSELIYYSKEIAFSPAILYHYNCTNTSSFINTPSLQKTFYQINATKLIESFLEEKCVIRKFNTELRLRKIYTKEPLRKINYELWRDVFPEVNYYIDLDNDNKVVAFIRKCLHKLLMYN